MKAALQDVQPVERSNERGPPLPPHWKRGLSHASLWQMGKNMQKSWLSLCKHTLSHYWWPVHAKIIQALRVCMNLSWCCLTPASAHRRHALSIEVWGEFPLRPGLPDRQEEIIMLVNAGRNGDGWPRDWVTLWELSTHCIFQHIAMTSAKQERCP